MAAALPYRYRRINLNGTLLRIASNLEPPWWFLKNPDDPPYDGLSYPFLLFLAEYLNFKWELIDQDGDWGLKRFSDHNFTGLVGSILSGRTHFAMGGVSNSIPLFNNLTASSDFIQISRITYLTLKSGSKIDSGVIFSPFDPIAGSLMAFSCVFTIILAIILRKLIKIQVNFPWFVFQAFLHQSFKYPTINWFGINFLIQICCWTGLFFYQAYSLIIISRLTDIESYNVISDVQQFSAMAAQQKLIPVMSEKSPYFDIFEKYKKADKIYKILCKNMKKADSHEDAIYQMIKHQHDIEFGNFSPVRNPSFYSVIGTFKYLNMFANRLGSQYFVYKDDIDTAFFTDYYGLLFRANSTMIPYFNQCIKIARECGFFVKWFVYDKPVWTKKFPELESMLSRLNQNRKLDNASSNQSTKLTLNIAPWFIGNYKPEFVAFDGSSYQFLLFMANYFNFTYELQHDLKLELNKDLNGNYTGLIGSLLKGDSDFALGILPLNYPLINPLVKASEMIDITRLKYITLLPKPEDVYRTLFTPFDLQVWIYFTLTMIILLAAGSIFEKIIPSGSDIYWLMFSSLLQRGKYSIFQSNAMNLLIQLCWWFGFILIASYGSIIISSLTDDIRFEEINGVNDFIRLINDSLAEPIMGDSGTFNYYFENRQTQSEVFEILSIHMVLTPSYLEAFRLMFETRLNKKAQQPVYATIGADVYLDLWTRTLNEQLFSAYDLDQSTIISEPYGMLFRANYSFIIYFNQCIRIARECEQLIPLKQELENELFALTKRQMGKTLMLENVKEVFSTYLICLKFNTIIFFVEIIYIACKIKPRLQKLIKSIRFFNQQRISTSTEILIRILMLESFSKDDTTIVHKNISR
ncbi:hypothetical protein HUG17_6979 [Dermatophagoides farinae]|uniref:Uncharacterized protein n=1 Tax=Dermatophagoides farinae TaxID=6954 RepID=A0A9D4SCQ2_DERFA|nr:hypothetical protein HUG17_6979 [Dermatophagoides farinae]